MSDDHRNLGDITDPRDPLARLIVSEEVADQIRLNCDIERALKLANDRGHALAAAIKREQHWEARRVAHMEREAVLEGRISRALGVLERLELCDDWMPSVVGAIRALKGRDK